MLAEKVLMIHWFGLVEKKVVRFLLQKSVVSK